MWCIRHCLIISFTDVYMALVFDNLELENKRCILIGDSNKDLILMLF